MKYVLALCAALVLNATANLLMKVGMKAVQHEGGLLRAGVVPAVGTILTHPVLLIGLVCFGLNAALYMFALQSETLKISIAYPIMVGGGFALISVVAYFHPQLQERLTAGQLLGVAFVLIGVFAIALTTPTAAPSSH